MKLHHVLSSWWKFFIPNFSVSHTQRCGTTVAFITQPSFIWLQPSLILDFLWVSILIILRYPSLELGFAKFRVKLGWNHLNMNFILTYTNIISMQCLNTKWKKILSSWNNFEGGLWKIIVWVFLIFFFVASNGLPLEWGTLL